MDLRRSYLCSSLISPSRSYNCPTKRRDRHFSKLLNRAVGVFQVPCTPESLLRGTLHASWTHKSSLNSITANNMAQHEEEQAPGRAIRMYMKSIAQAARAASPIRRRKDEEKKKECPVQQGKTREPQCPTEAKEQQSPKENQKPMTEKEQFQKPIDFRISASNSLLASSSDREIEITGSVASKKIMERGATQNNILDSIGLNRPGQSTPSNHIRVQCHSSPAQSENSLSFRRVQSEKNVRETPTSVSTTSGPSPKGRSPRLPWKGSFGNKRLFKRLSKSPLRKKQVATALQEAEQNRSLLPTPASLTGGGNLPAEPPFHQHSLAPQETDNE